MRSPALAVAFVVARVPLVCRGGRSPAAPEPTPIQIQRQVGRRGRSAPGRMPRPRQRFGVVAVATFENGEQAEALQARTR
jgi:hypothetical protein